jgi:hypothetical protein
MQGSGKYSILDVNSREDKYEIVLGMKELASKGMAAEVVEEVNAMDPKLFVQNPILLFQLKQVSRSYHLWLHWKDIIYGGNYTYPSNYHSICNIPTGFKKLQCPPQLPSPYTYHLH